MALAKLQEGLPPSLQIGLLVAGIFIGGYLGLRPFFTEAGKADSEGRLSAIAARQHHGKEKIMSLQTRRPEEDKEQQFTFTPHETTPPPVPPPVTPPVIPPVPPAGTTPPDWRELRRQERADRRATRHAGRTDGSYRWIGGAILILLGGLSLLQNSGFIQRFDNWWALFILIPAVGAFASAWRIYQQSGNQWTSPATGSLLSGLILTGLVVMFLVGFDIAMWWPLFLIAGGIAILLSARQWR